MGRPRLPENEANAQLAQDARDANALGISYGQYSSLIYQGKLKRNYVKDEIRIQDEMLTAKIEASLRKGKKKT